MKDRNAAPELETEYEPQLAGNTPGRLRLLTYNIQTGIQSSHYGHYVTRSWQHLFPHADRPRTLKRVARLTRPYDLVGLQEVDGGSLRSGFINQTEFVSRLGGFPYWHDQTNRRIGKLARHSNGFLSRYRPLEIREHALPGMIPGRGALHMTFGGPGEPLHVILLHLALGARTRMRQLGYVADLIAPLQHVVVMGDLNCTAESREIRALLDRTSLSEPTLLMPTYPSWRPLHPLDHILVSSSLQVERAEVVDYSVSDHLPVAMDIKLPDSVILVP